MKVVEGSTIHITCDVPVAVNVGGKDLCVNQTECTIPVSGFPVGKYEGTYVYYSEHEYKIVVEIVPGLKCEGYGFVSFTFPLNKFHYILPPRCSSPVTVTLGEGFALPAGLNLDPTGRISGVATSLNKGSSVTLIASDDESDVQIIFILFVKDVTPEFGILSQTTYEMMNGLTTKEDFKKLYSRLINGELATINSIYTKNDNYCKSIDGCKTKVADIDEVSSNRYTIWSSYVQFRTTSVKGFYLPIDSSILSHSAMIINNNIDDIILPNVDDSVYTFSKEIPEIDGYYYVSFILYDVSIKEQLSVLYSDDGKNFIPIQAGYEVYPTPIQYFSYINNNGIIYKSVEKQIVPIVYGGYSANGWECNLPDFLKLNNKGEISYDGNTEAAFPETEQKYVIKPKDSSFSYDLYLLFKESTVENMGNGLVGKYYKTNIVECEYNKMIESKKLKFKKYDKVSSIIHNVESNELWNGLSFEFNNNFYVKWDGYINIPLAGTYEIKMTVNDGGRIMIEENELLIQNCGLSNSLKDFQLSVGLNKLSVEYWKSHNDNKKIFKIEYRCKSCDPNSELSEIPDEILYYLHPSKLYYENEVGSYLVGEKLLIKGLSSLNQDDFKKYNSFTSSSIDYPINFEVADISTTLDKSLEWKMISINAESVDTSSYPTLITSIIIEVNKYDKPEGFTYSESVVNKKLGEEVALKATLTSGSEGTKYTIESNNLPVGLTFDSENGDIKGRLLEVMTEREVIIRASNPGGNADFTIKFTVTGCEENSHFFLLNIIQLIMD